MPQKQLTREQKERKLLLLREKAKRKVAKSFLFFISNFCYIIDKTTKEAIKFKLWPAQQKILPDILTAMLLVILKARQLGLTWICAAYVLWYCITKKNRLVIVISAKGDWAVEFLERVYFMLRRLPSWLCPEILKETTEVLTFKHSDGSESTIKSLPTTEAGAQSKTPDVLILDESCWNPYIREIYSASKPGIDAAGGRIIIISNSIKYAPGWGWTRDIYTGAMKGLSKFKRVFMPWQDRPDRPKDFKERQLLEAMTEDEFSLQYPETEEEAISTLTGSYFGKTLAKHKNFVSGEFGRIEKGLFVPDKKGIIEVWEHPYSRQKDYAGAIWTHRFAMGSDVSEGLGLSYSVAYVIDRLTDQIVARIRSNTVDAFEWAGMLHDLSKYYDNALLCVERTGAGQTTVKELQNLKANQYIEIISGKAGNPVTKQLGWGETHQKKHELCGDLKEWLKTTEGGFNCPYLLDESSTWIRHENGRLGPEAGKLGDCVIAAGLTIQASQFLRGMPKESLEEAKKAQKEADRAKLEAPARAAWKELDDIREDLEREEYY
jgi:hypothetical protein